MYGIRSFYTFMFTVVLSALHFYCETVDKKCLDFNLIFYKKGTSEIWWVIPPYKHRYPSLKFDHLNSADHVLSTEPTVRSKQFQAWRLFEIKNILKLLKLSFQSKDKSYSFLIIEVINIRVLHII